MATTSLHQTVHGRDGVVGIMAATPLLSYGNQMEKVPKDVCFRVGQEISKQDDERSFTDSAFGEETESPDIMNSSPESSDSGCVTDTTEDSNTPLTKHEKTEEDPEVNSDPEVNVKDADNLDKSFWLKILMIFSILDVLLLITIFVVVFGIPRTDSSTIHSRRCLPCMDVYLTDDDKNDNIYNFTIDGDNCCSENETLLIQKYVIKRYKSDQARASAERVFPQRTAIHLDLDEKDENSVNEGSNQVLKWTTPDLMFGNLSLSSDRTRIHVNRTGLYYISSRVVFNDTKGDIGVPGLDPMTLQVHREKTSGEHQLLLETKETHCANSDAKCAKPSSGQGVFRMERGDSVVVRVTKPCGLVLRDKMNHFDMYLI